MMCVLSGSLHTMLCCMCCAGVILFQLSSDTEPVNGDTRVMEIFISGDACISIYTHLCPSDNTRPMALDILWQVRAGHHLLVAPYAMLQLSAQTSCKLGAGCVAHVLLPDAMAAFTSSRRCSRFAQLLSSLLRHY